MFSSPRRCNELFSVSQAVVKQFTVHSSHIPFNDFLGELSAEWITEICLSSDVVINLRAHLLHLWKDLNCRGTTANDRDRLSSVIPTINHTLENKYTTRYPS